MKRFLLLLLLLFFLLVAPHTVLPSPFVTFSPTHSSDTLLMKKIMIGTAADKFSRCLC